MSQTLEQKWSQITLSRITNTTQSLYFTAKLTTDKLIFATSPPKKPRGEASPPIVGDPNLDLETENAWNCFEGTTGAYYGGGIIGGPEDAYFESYICLPHMDVPAITGLGTAIGGGKGRPLPIKDHDDQGYFWCVWTYDIPLLVDGIALARWARDLATGTNASTSVTAGPLGEVLVDTVPLGARIRDSAFVATCVATCYHSLFIEFIDTPNPFRSLPLNVLSPESMKTAIQSNVEMWTASFSGFFSSESDYNMEPLAALLGASIEAPRPFQDANNGNGYYLDMNLTIELLKNCWDETGETLDNSVLSRYLATFLQDSLSTITTTSTGERIVPEPLQVEYDASYSGDVKAIMLNLNPENYSLDTNILVVGQGPDFQVSTGDTNLYALHYVVRVKVTAWSPMLISYFADGSRTDYTFSMDETTCNSMLLFPQTCVTEANRCEVEQHSCGYQYDAPPGASGYEEALVYAGAVDIGRGSAICGCYNAELGPPGETDTRSVSRCFFDECNDPFHLESTCYGSALTDDACKASCDRMRGWIESNDPANHGVNLDSFSKTRFDRICGDGILEPYAEPLFNTNAFAGMLVVAVLSTIVFALWLSRWYSTRQTRIKYGVCVAAVALVLIGLAVFSGFALAGEATCLGDSYPRSSACQSKLIPNARLAQSYCTYVAQCDCATDNDCISGVGGCACRDGACLSDNDNRGIQRKTVTEASPNVLVPFILSGILVSLGIMESLRLTNGAGLGRAKALVTILVPGFAIAILGLALGIRVNGNYLVFSDIIPPCKSSA